jgi:hypothetical protein
MCFTTSVLTLISTGSVLCYPCSDHKVNVHVLLHTKFGICAASQILLLQYQKIFHLMFFMLCPVGLAKWAFLVLHCFDPEASNRKCSSVNCWRFSRTSVVMLIVLFGSFWSVLVADEFSYSWRLSVLGTKTQKTC